MLSIIIAVASIAISIGTIIVSGQIEKRMKHTSQILDEMIEREKQSGNW